MSGTERVAVYGAGGHTGGLVARQLAERGFAPVLGGRDAEALARAAERLRAAGPYDVETRPAAVDDPGALGRLADGCAAVVNCAGPFSGTASAVARAAVAAGVHYVDTCAEPAVVRQLLAEMDAPARAAGVAVVPSMAFYCALGDLLAHVAAGELGEVDEVLVAYAVEGWELTPGSLRVVPEVGAQRFVVEGGTLRLYDRQPGTFEFPFPEPVGPGEVVSPYPSADPVAIARHVRARRVRAAMTTSTLQEVAASAGRPAGEPRRESSFTVVARASRGETTVDATARGGDIYAISAPIVVEAVARLLDGPPRRGALAAGEAFPAAELLATLEHHGVRLDLPTPLLVARYGAAWNAHDLDRIMSFHTDDTVYRGYGPNQTGEPHTGRQAVREAFGALLAGVPDLRFELRTARGDGRHAVFESLVTGTSALRGPVAFRAIDLLLLEAGRIAAKHTYLAPGDTDLH
ncbi:MAG TPA: nuclear transport factor 2 family protein [Solirubrobacteraceae bacterium]|nr:nuclear transport factor 2 family protein [Solirubrobacteraceae bacterium]